MTTTFLHTADWQLGKPFGRIDDFQKRSLVQEARFRAIKHLGVIAHKHNAQFIIVAGDLFDSPSPSQAVVAQTCATIGQLKLPTYVIPGNHDHAGPDSLWNTPFFKREHEKLAPNLHLLLTPEPLEIETAILFPCPLIRRHETSDLSLWLRNYDFSQLQSAQEKPRIVIAHGTIIDFQANPAEEEDIFSSGSANYLDIKRLPDTDFDYIALGDWHGFKQITPKAWYAGTPEPDRFAKSDENQPGHCLIVQAQRSHSPIVQPIPSQQLEWHQLAFHFSADSDLLRFQETLNTLIANRAQEDLLRLELSGSLGIDASHQLDQLLESLTARLLRLKLRNTTRIAPTESELQTLTERSQDPLIALVAKRLLEKVYAQNDDSYVAELALRELYAATLVH